MVLGVLHDITILEAPAGTVESARIVHLFRDVTATKELLGLVDLATGRGRGSVVGGARGQALLEILQLMASGANTSAMAERLHVSPATVRNHAQNIFAKLGVHSRLEAVAWANRHRLL
jgi:DNA-binding CsgD family transcriptional regulator